MTMTTISTRDKVPDLIGVTLRESEDRPLDLRKVPLSTNTKPTCLTIEKTENLNLSELSALRIYDKNHYFPVSLLYFVYKG